MQVSILLVQIATLIVLVISVLTLRSQVVALRSQISKGHEWNRRKAAQDLVDHMYRIGYYEITEELHNIPCADGKCININDQQQTYDDVVDDYNKEHIGKCLRPLLGFCEEVALGVRHNIYDSDVAYDYLGFLAPNIYRWSEPYVRQVREETEDQTIYIEVQDLSKKWRKKSEEEKEKAQLGQRTQAKKAL